MKNQYFAITVGIALALIFSLIVLNPERNISAGESGSPQTIDEESLRIVYLASSEDQAELGALSPQSISSVTGAEVIHDWGELDELLSAGSIDALLVHPNALETIDPSSLRLLYDQGTVLVFFNVYSPVIVELVGDECISRDGWMDGSDPYEGDFYVIVSRLIQGSPEDINAIKNESTCDGEVEPVVEGNASVYANKAQNALDEDATLVEFYQVLLNAIQNIRTARSEFVAK